VSVQFGTWNLDGRPVEPDYLARVRTLLAPYGPDGEGAYIKDGAAILYRPFHTTRESRLETQPCLLKSGEVLVWDGRLDNRAEFIALPQIGLSCDSSDVAVVAAAYERWGIDGLGRLLGDWALTIWNPRDCSLILAKDPLGIRHLYYSADRDHINWCTVLDPLVLLAGKTLALDEEYIAGWLGMFPATHLTPYAAISAVPPSCIVRLEKGRKTTTKYWDFDPAKRIRYVSDADYEEHFRVVFRDAVRRRLRSDAPVLAELSGGMDSSSIVCMADRILSCGLGETPRLDTVSYYDDSEPNWNERPYLAKVEEKRGRAGCHINVQSEVFFTSGGEAPGFRLTPASHRKTTNARKTLSHWSRTQGHRVLLSGIGGDEVTGGVPSAAAELRDLIASARFWALARQLGRWALATRKPMIAVLWRATRAFLPPTLPGLHYHAARPDWLRAEFVRKHQAVLMGYAERTKLSGPRPSFQENKATIAALQRQLASREVTQNPLFDKCYPFLDRDLLQFLLAVPPEQLARPGQRRSLMHRSLADLIPHEILNRRRKAFVARSPITAIANEWERLSQISSQMLLESRGIVAGPRFAEALCHARRGEEVPIALLLRTIALEDWLRSFPGEARVTAASRQPDELTTTIPVRHAPHKGSGSPLQRKISERKGVSDDEILQA